MSASTESRKRRFDQLETLRKASWEKIESRRKYEWMASIALWTLQASALVFLQRIQFKPPELALFICALPIILIVIHCSWLKGAHRAYMLDQDEESAFREAMRKQAGYIESTEITDLRQAIRCERKDSHFYQNWNHESQLGITIVLSIALIVLLIQRAIELLI